jgi:hypothetical protein
MTGRRLSDIAQHLRQPTGIAGSLFAQVNRIALKAGISYDLWQQGLLYLMLAKRSDGRYACAEGGTVVSSCRQTGKTFTIATCLFILSILIPGFKTMWTAHHTRTSDETFADLCDLARNRLLSRHVDRIRRANGQQEIIFRNGSRIMFGARENGFGRGLHGVDALILDEAQILTERALDNMLPTVNTAPDPLIVFLGNPPKPGDPCEVFEGKRISALSGVDGMVYVELSADRDADPDDREQWAKANPSYPKRTSDTAIQRLRTLMPEDSFRREALGVWNDMSARSAIDPECWAASALPQRRPGGWIGMGVDMPPDRSSLAIGACMGYADHTAHIELARFMSTQSHGTAWAVDWIAERWPRLASVVIDAQSPAAVLLPDLKARHVRVTTTNAADMGRAVGMFQDLLRDGKLKHLDGQRPLDIAVSGCTLRPIGSGGAYGWNKLGSDVDISPLVAATLALYGTMTTKRRPGEKRRMVQLR